MAQRILILGSDCNERSLKKDLFSFMEHKPLMPEPTRYHECSRADQALQSLYFK